MAYADVAALYADFDFRQRTAAAYSTETLNDLGANPEIWQRDHGWKVASQPGFGDAYASALASNNPNPGSDPAVITDAQLLTAVQTIIAAESTA